jgi:hypothetical protein
MDDTGIDRRTILKWTFQNLERGVWNEFAWLRTETRGGFFPNTVTNICVLCNACHNSEARNKNDLMD